jgi:uncharacterized membrane protein
MMLGGEITNTDRSSIPASVRLLITLRLLASGDSYRSLMYFFKVSDSTISIIVPQVCASIKVLI